MPPLYRMPVFYLTISLLGLTLGIVSLFSGEETSVRDTSPENSNLALVDSNRPDSKSPTNSTIKAPLPISDDGILRTADGLRRKVLVNELALVPRSDPNDSVTNGTPLDYYSIHFVYDETPPDAPEPFFEIGPMEGPPIGWVPARSVLEWDTRLMALPTPRKGRSPLVVYRDDSCLLDALAGRDCVEHGDTPCPIVGEEPASVEAGSTADPSFGLGLPILQSLSIPQPEGPPRTIFEVASLVRDQAPPPPPPSEPPAHMQRALKQVYLAFVIDTTASMQDYIKAAKQVAETLVEEAARLDVSLRLGLVEYRDQPPVYTYQARIVSPFTDPDRFRSALERIEAADRGNGTVDGKALEGIARALPPVPGEALQTASHLTWPGGREGELATKLVVLLGDAPDRDRDLDRAQTLAEHARSAGITIASVSIDRPAMLSRDEASRYRNQWETLAERSFRPRDRASNFSEPIPPVQPNLTDAKRLAPTLQAIIEDRVEHAKELAALALAEAEGRLTEYVNSQGLTLDQVAPVLVDLHGGQPRPEASPDPRHQGRKAPSVRLGWVAERVQGNPLVTVQILLTRQELDQLIGELTQLQQAIQGGATDLSDLLRIGTAAAVGEAAFLSADRGEQTFADHLRRRRGLPPARSGSLLDRSQGDLLQADDLYRAALDTRLSRGISTLIQRRNAIDWSNPQQVADGMALVPYEAIDF